MTDTTSGLFDILETVTSGGGAALAATNYNFTVTSAESCYIPTYPQPSYPVYPVYPTHPSTFVNVLSYPAMHPHACPICEGRQTVEAGFYRDVAEDKGPQKCRTCRDGLVYTP